MGKIVITEAGQFNGSYHLDFQAQPQNHWEAHILKQIAGIKPNELADALSAGDADVFIAWAIMALVRAGRISQDQWQPVKDFLMLTPVGAIWPEDEPVPAPVADEDPPLPVDVSADAAGMSSTSGDATSTGSGSPETIPTATGLPGSDTGAPSQLVTSPE